MERQIVDSSVALRRGQEQAVANIEAAKKGKISDKYMQGVVMNDENMSFRDKAVTAGIMNNFQRIMDSESGQRFMTQPDYGPYVPEIWPLVVAWYAEFPLKELVSVQDMKQDLAYMFFSCLKTGTNKAPTQVGEVVETATGSRTIKGRYPTGEVFGETIAASEVKFVSADHVSQILLAYAPLNVDPIPGNLGKVKIEVYSAESTLAATLIPNTINDGVIALKTAAGSSTSHTLDINTGLFTYAESGEAVATSIHHIVANYVWQLDFATPENLMTVKEEVEMIPMQAIPRALMLEWSLFSEFLKKSQFGQDIRKDNTERILSLLFQYQTRYIIDDMYTYAAGNGGSPVSISLPTSTAISVNVKAQTVMQNLKNAANLIEIASGRIEGNRIVCGKNFKSFLESLDKTWFTPSKSATDYGFSTPRHIGDFGTFKVYYDPTFAANQAMMTYRGSEWYDAAYYVGEYVPIVPTDAVALGVTVRESFVSMEAYKYHKPTCVVKLQIADA